MNIKEIEVLLSFVVQVEVEFHESWFKWIFYIYWDESRWFYKKREEILKFLLFFKHFKIKIILL